MNVVPKMFKNDRQGKMLQIQREGKVFINLGVILRIMSIGHLTQQCSENSFERGSAAMEQLLATRVFLSHSGRLYKCVSCHLIFANTNYFPTSSPTSLGCTQVNQQHATTLM